MPGVSSRVVGAWHTEQQEGGDEVVRPSGTKANGGRIDQGDLGPSFPSQRVDHVIGRSGGNVLGPDGLPIAGSIKQNPQAHIPLDDWLTWTSWNTP